jgi:diguanylate cyclase (GGDEF)-like protein/PAS domain S-box-containing protein
MNWVVLLEAERRADCGIDGPMLRQLLRAVADARPRALHCADRYALQLCVDAASPAEAFQWAVERWREATRHIGLPDWALVRIETLTQAEFERECIADGCDNAVDVGVPGDTTEADEQRRVEEALLRHAFHDAMTDLANEGLFFNALERLLTEPATRDMEHALLLIDVDKFGETNDCLGRTAGDSVLVALAQRLVRTAGTMNTVARIGGDQFAVMLSGTERDEAVSMATRIVDNLAAPLTVESQQIRPTVSVGIALGRFGDTCHQLLTWASAALRTAQERGGQRYEMFSADMVDADVRRLQAERELMPLPDATAHLALLERASPAVNQAATFEEAAAVVIGQVCEHVGFGTGRLYLRTSGGRDGLWAAYNWPVSAPHRPGLGVGDATDGPLQPEHGLAGLALASGRPSADTRRRMDEPVPPTTGLRAVLAVPVVVGTETVAVLEFSADHPLDPSGGLLAAMTTLGAVLAGAHERARLERKVTQGQEQLQAVLDVAGTTIKILGADGRVRGLYPFDEVGDTAGAPANAVDFVHPDDLSVAVKGWAEALRSPGPHPPFECRLRQPDGSWRWMEVLTTNMLGSAEIRGIVTGSRDVTDRKLLEEALQWSEVARREAEAVGRVGTWHIDLVRREGESSAEMCRILGLAPGSSPLAFDELLAAVHPDERRAVEEQRRLVECGSANLVEFRMRTPEGVERWISMRCSAGRDHTGQIVSLHGTAQDVTDRKLLEQRIRESGQQVRDMQTLAGVGIWHTEVATGRTIWSPELYDVLGLDPGQVTPTLDRLLAVVQTDGEAAVTRPTTSTVMGMPVVFGCQIVRPDGSVRWIEGRTSAVRGGAGEIVACSGVVWDATERRAGQPSVLL